MIVNTLGIYRHMENRKKQFAASGGILFKDSSDPHQLRPAAAVANRQIRRCNVCLSF